MKWLKQYVSYTAEHKAKALECYTVCNGSAHAAARHALLFHKDLFPAQVTFSALQRRIRVWVQKAEQGDLVSEPVQRGRRRVVPEECMDVIKESVLRQARVIVLLASGLLHESEAPCSKAFHMQVTLGMPVNKGNVAPLVKSVLYDMGSQDLLYENGGTFKCSPDWMGRMLHSINLSWRSATTAAQKMPDDWGQQLRLMSLR